MRPFRWSFSILFFLLVSYSVYADKVSIKYLDKQSWQQLETEHFIVVSNAKEKQLYAIAEELENFRYFVGVLLGFEQLDSNHSKVKVILAKNKGTFRAMGIPKEYGGVYARDHREMAFFATSSGFKPSDSGKSNWERQIILHELTHHLMHNSSLDMHNPPWYSEGIAEYLGSYKIKKQKIYLGDVSLLRYRFISLLDGSKMESIHSNALFKTERLPIGAGMSRSDRKYLDKFYARSVGVVHYLNADPERRKKMHQFLLLLKKGFSVDESFQYLFEMTYEEFDREIADYVQGRYVYARIFDIGENGIQFPALKAELSQLSKKDAMKILIRSIGIFSPGFLGEENYENMYDDLNAIYPNIFKE